MGLTSGIDDESLLRLSGSKKSSKQSTIMSQKARGFGLTAELEKKKAGKFDADRANETLEWLKDVLVHADSSDPDIATIVEVSAMADVAKVLKDGRVLCKVMNVLYPGTIKKINKIDNPNSPF